MSDFYLLLILLLSIVLLVNILRAQDDVEKWVFMFLYPSVYIRHELAYWICHFCVLFEICASQKRDIFHSAMLTRSYEVRPTGICSAQIVTSLTRMNKSGVWKDIVFISRLLNYIKSVQLTICVASFLLFKSSTNYPSTAIFGVLYPTFLNYVTCSWISKVKEFLQIIS